VTPTWSSDCGRVRLYRADCMDVLPELGPFDALVTDPPYGIQNGAFTRGAARVITHGSHCWNEPPDAAWCGMVRLVDGGNAAIFHSYLNEPPVPGEWRKWGKFFLLKAAPPPTPKPSFVSSVEECSVYQSPGTRRWYGTGYEVNHWRGLTPNRQNQAVHPSQKPLAPIMQLVECLSPAGGTVLDPFMGSGTTGVAAVRNGMQFVGIEREPDYFDAAVSRIKGELAQGQLFAGVGA